MAEAEETRDNNVIWGTWEELLLVSAVNKHGINNWDSVAMEIQNRTPNFILTPHICKQKYQQLRRRFKETDNNNNDDDDNNDNTIPWLDELRKLRVAELKREVQQYDVSIVSLQLKVKRLTEEREQSPQVKPDLDTTEREKPVSGEDSDRDNQSFNESNSTDLKTEKQVTDGGVDESDKIKPNKIVAGAGDGADEIDPVTADEDKRVVVVEEGSWNGSSETINIAKDSVVSQTLQKSSEPIKNREAGDSAELWDSVESKGAEAEEEEGTKENSDVQSSANLSMKNRRKTGVVVSVSSSGDGSPDNDEISPAIKRISVKSQPLAKFLEMVKSHKYGYVFERRLESQESSKYMSVIRQHLDLEIVNRRLQEGQYSGCSRKFYRDLLVIINNAIVYFPNNSVEFTAATELRQIVSKEMGLRIQKFNQSPKTRELAPPIIHPLAVPKLDLEPSDSLLMKQKSSVPMIACRKRSSIIYKAAPERKVEKKEAVVEDKKPVLDRKKQDNPLVSLAEEKIVMKKEKRDRPASGTRSSRTVSKNSNRNLSPSSNQASSSKGGTAAEDNSETMAEKEKNNNSTVAKKRSVANFLNRMKKNTSSNDNLLDSLKNSGNSSNNSKGGNTEQKKSSGGKGDVRKEQATRQSVSRRQTRDHTSPAKRSVGRPPKRNASSPITPPVPSKRSRETIETEAAASRQPRKRSRR